MSDAGTSAPAAGPAPLAEGETPELPLTLFYRPLRHAQVGGGTSEVHRMLISRSPLR